MKKTVFELIFQLFLEVVPTSIVSQLPGELWEKIWKHTQNGYFRYSASQPLGRDREYFKAGLRAGQQPSHLRTVEQVSVLLAC
jgi:hypothetical protein